ncbi:MAG: hypothetical protein ACR2QO_17990 [Acidimicrobiales bacterium]
MGTASLLYRVVLLLHIGASIVAFGGLIANGVLNARAFNGPSGEGGVVLAAGRAVSKLADYALYALLPLGIVLIAVSDDAFGFGDPWVSASFVVWFAVVGVTHGLVRPAVRTMSEQVDSLGGSGRLADDATSVAASRKLMLGETFTQLLLATALILMIWKPGA